MLANERGALLVDDDADDRFLVERAWQEAGIATPLTCVGAGQSALDLLRGPGPRPAFVLLDIKMPGTSGFDVLRRLRGAESTRALPVIIFTASTSAKDVEQAYRLGANAFFVKPSSAAELIELLVALKNLWLRYNEFPA